MSRIQGSNWPDQSRPLLHVFEAPRESTLTPKGGVLRWLIDGFPAIVLIWTQEQWSDLEVRPTDAQFHPQGFWCALRME